MKILETIQKTREYLDYLESHIMNIQKAWEVVKEKCKDMRFVWDDYYYFSLQDDIEHHDMSKMSEEEFVQYRKVFYPTNDEIESGNHTLDDAWGHHKKCNRHHLENWTVKNYWHPNEWENHCAHMVIDWMAMGYAIGGTAQEYYEQNKEKIDLPEYAEKFIYQIFEKVYD